MSDLTGPLEEAAMKMREKHKENKAKEQAKEAELKEKRKKNPLI